MQAPTSSADLVTGCAGHDRPNASAVTSKVFYCRAADGRHVIAGGVDRVSVYIDATNGEISHRMDRDAEPAEFLYVSEDGLHFGVQSLKAENMLQPASVTVWEVESRRKVVAWMPSSLVLNIAWTQDGRLLATTARKEALDVWQVL